MKMSFTMESPPLKVVGVISPHFAGGYGELHRHSLFTTIVNRTQ
jgi:hypothetical protein